MDNAWLRERIAALKLRIVALEDSALESAGTDVNSYTLDTGQTRQTVTRLTPGQIQKTLSELNNQLAVYQQRLSGSNSFIGRPTN